MSAARRDEVNAADRLGLDVLASVMDASLDGIAVIDGRRRYLYVNPAGSRILGYPAAASSIHDFGSSFRFSLVASAVTTFTKVPI